MPNTNHNLKADDFIELGLKPALAEELAQGLKRFAESVLTAPERWSRISRRLLKPSYPFDVHRLVFNAVFKGWDETKGPPPVWIPDNIDTSNISWLMKASGNTDYKQLYEWSIRERSAFLQAMIQRLGIRFQRNYSTLLDITAGVDNARWLPEARFNIVDSCFAASDESPAVLYQKRGEVIRTVTIGQLRALAFRVANGLVTVGIKPGDIIAIDMPMGVEAVAILLGAIANGCNIATIADTFSSQEIEKRLKLTRPKCIFTQDFRNRRSEKPALYEKVKSANSPRAVVLPLFGDSPLKLRDRDLSWEQFLSDKDTFTTVTRSPADPVCILFSSGTTAEPKAIPWDQTTPIKSAIDGHLHHDIRPGDIICWPTNLGWMMGPWLVFSSLINRAAMALHYGAPTSKDFAGFVQDAAVSMLGVVPSIVASWRASQCLDGCDWSRIRVFSSTGECSNPQDMFYLMAQAGYKPVVEYCGGTEIGGAYITGTVVQPAIPGTFSTPALGSEWVILDDNNHPADEGEVFLIPPAMGLSQSLINFRHHDVYFADTPAGPKGKQLRRHGDRMMRLANGYFKALGRMDDTMNLAGMKVGARWIEETVNEVAGVQETAAISIPPPEGGPEKLVIYAVKAEDEKTDSQKLRLQMQSEIKKRLNPLFRIHAVHIVEKLPRTASKKVMRRALREMYTSGYSHTPSK